MARRFTANVAISEESGRAPKHVVRCDGLTITIRIEERQAHAVARVLNLMENPLSALVVEALLSGAESDVSS